VLVYTGHRTVVSDPQVCFTYILLHFRTRSTQKSKFGPNFALMTYCINWGRNKRNVGPYELKRRFIIGTPGGYVDVLDFRHVAPFRNQSALFDSPLWKLGERLVSEFYEFKPLIYFRRRVSRPFGRLECECDGCQEKKNRSKTIRR